MKEGATYTSSVTVTLDNCAVTMGSGDLAVFATPALVALMENAAMKLVAGELPNESTTVGGEMNILHLKPSHIGAVVSATAKLTSVVGRKLTFEVAAYDNDVLVGKGMHVRFIVDRERFMK